MEFPARNDGHATQQKKKKQRRKSSANSKIYMQEMMHPGGALRAWVRRQKEDRTSGLT
jgi:hypothetical protein